MFQDGVTLGLDLSLFNRSNVQYSWSSEAGWDQADYSSTELQYDIGASDSQSAFLVGLKVEKEEVGEG